MDDQILSISELTEVLRHIIESTFTEVIVRGEVSNFKQHSSGHRYFTLKDDKAQISCALWRGVSVPLTLQDGMEVIAGGYLSLYPPRGSYQLIVRMIQPAGIGALQRAFEEVKNRLLAEGLFSPERKIPLPQFPKTIGIATSATGAALRDMLTTLERRYPLAEVYLSPCAVQGEEAPASIIHALRLLDSSGCDVIIVGRGGGSLEDLWAFNTESVVRAVASVRTPIISAVGHETDVVLTDFAADVRAATPTAAAELATPDCAQLYQSLNASAEYATSVVTDTIEQHRRRLEQLRHHYALRRAEDLPQRLREQLAYAQEKMSSIINNKLNNHKNDLRHKQEHLLALHPLAPLQRGYAILRSAQSNIALSATTPIQPEDTLVVQRLQDSFTVTVRSKT